MTNTPNTPIEELALIFKTHTFERSGLIDVPSVKIALLAWRDRAVVEALTRLKEDLKQHTVPEGRDLLTRSYVNNSIDFEIARLTTDKANPKDESEV